MTSHARRLLATAACAATVLGSLVAAGTGASAATRPSDSWGSEYGGGSNASADLGEHTITAKTAARMSPVWRHTVHGEARAPSIVDGVAYRADNPNNANDRQRLVATKASTGATLWGVRLPAGQTYEDGQTVVDGLVLMPFSTQRALGGITAVDLRSHKVVWNRARYARYTVASGKEDGTAYPIVVGNGRVYLAAGDRSVAAYRVRTGTPIWHRTTSDYSQSIAAGDDDVFSVGEHGLVAYSGSSGHERWSSAYGTDDVLLAAGRIFATDGNDTVALAEKGCGHATCRPLWRTPVPSGDDGEQDLLGGASSSSVFVLSSPAAHTSVLRRLTAKNGHVAWSVTVARSGSRPVRVGDTVWLSVGATELEAWSASATRSAPLVTIPEHSGGGALQGIAAADGTLTLTTWPNHLVGYRVGKG